MKIIADSSSTRTDWVLVDGERVVEQASTPGLNPYFLTRREISHIIRLELPDTFFKKRWTHIYFYGAGCANPQKNKVVEQSLVAQFRTPATVDSDLLGAARGLLIHQPGLACILSTGANSCLYDGENIVKSVRPAGFILGDEGSNAYLGKRLVSDILKGLAPAHITEAFYEYFHTTPNEVMDRVYSPSSANLALAEYSYLLSNMISDPYCEKMVYDGFMAFFRRNIIFYDYVNLPLSFVGRTGCLYPSILARAASDFGATIAAVEPTSLPGLVKFHADS